MSDIAIRVDNLGKQYRIGGQQKGYKRFSETAMDALTAPVRRLRRLGRPAPADETFWALQDVAFEIQRGEAVGIIGRNGAGKSTLLKILSRITEPSTGRVELHGRVASLLEVGTGFHPELTGRENVYLNGAILGMHRSEIERKFDEIVEFSGVAKFLDTPVKRYSSGMQGPPGLCRGRPSRARDPSGGRGIGRRRRRVPEKVPGQDGRGGQRRTYCAVREP